MGRLLSAARAWKSMLPVSYAITIGRKGKMRVLSLQFRPVDFFHLSGIHYANDVDFKLHKNEYAGKKLLNVLLSGKMDDSLIEKSCRWPQISDRLVQIVHLRSFLESEFTIYEFSPKKLSFFSRISAQFLLYNEHSQAGVFLFIDEDEKEAVFYCKSVFAKGELDYCRNQSQWTVLKKIRIDGGGELLLYRHPRFIENKR